MPILTADKEEASRQQWAIGLRLGVSGGPRRIGFLLSDHFDQNLGYSVHQHVELARRSGGQIDDPACFERAAVVYPHDNAFSVGEIPNANQRSERKPGMSCGEFGWVEAFTARRNSAAKFVAVERGYTCRAPRLALVERRTSRKKREANKQQTTPVSERVAHCCTGVD